MENWRKSRASTAEGGSCIEVASGNGQVGIRDTKQAHMGEDRTVLEVTPGAFRDLVARVMTGL